MNKLKTLIKFLFIFSLTTILPMGLYFYYKHSTIPYYISSFNDDKIRETCPLSPDREFYSQCLQKKISRMFAEASLFDLHKITTLIIETKNRDLFVSNFTIDEPKEKLYEVYLHNWVIAIDHLSAFTKFRKKTTFLEIFAFPLLRNIVYDQLLNLKNELNKLQVNETEKLITLKKKILTTKW